MDSSSCSLAMVLIPGKTGDVMEVLSCFGGVPSVENPILVDGSTSPLTVSFKMTLLTI